MDEQIEAVGAAIKEAIDEGCNEMAACATLIAAASALVGAAKIYQEKKQ